MSSTYGNKIKISVFGESHGNGIGVVIDGLPAGFKLDMDAILAQMSRRAPGGDRFSTPRSEKDMPEILSGELNGVTTGAPMCAVIHNTNTRSSDYQQKMINPRPSHADYPGYIRYSGFNDIRGGGHFSGRLTAPLVFAGSVCRQILESRGIFIGSHIYSIGNICDTPFNLSDIAKEQLIYLSQQRFGVIDDDKGQKMLDEIERARLDCDSIGGVIECAVTGVPAGIGNPMMDTLESSISSIVFAIPAVKGIEFGAGFEMSHMRGSCCNDAYRIVNGKVLTESNNNGGILGGISNGMPIVFRTAIKPTPSIGLEQNTVDLVKMENTTMVIHGRHDPCIVPRALSVIESATAIALIQYM